MTILTNRSARGETEPNEPASGTERPAFAPVDEVARYEAPRAGIDPDQSKTWLRRAWPIAATSTSSPVALCPFAFTVISGFFSRKAFNPAMT